MTNKKATPRHLRVSLAHAEIRALERANEAALEREAHLRTEVQAYQGRLDRGKVQVDDLSTCAKERDEAWEKLSRLESQASANKRLQLILVAMLDRLLLGGPQ